ncbi:unnamed protein product [Urochloa decumbens]|uniref:Protein kinase domain-containing protein n=1 Tax=Urochloa decumbens TaxID=240449 RepID=A0ABC8ZKE6_9POAL
MSGLHDSSVSSPPRGRGCCCSGASVLCKIVKGLLHVAIVGIISLVVFSGFADYNFSARIALESVSYAVIACLYFYTSSDREERIVSGIFLGILAVVIIVAAPSCKGETAPVAVIAGCNIVALSVYCIWKICALVQAFIRRLRVRGSAASADVEAPLAPVEKEAAAAAKCSPSAPVQPTTFRIEDLPRKFSYEEICDMTGDFGNMVGRGGSGEVFRGLLDDGTAVAIKRITSDKPVGEQDFLQEISIVANVHQRSLVRLLGYCLLRGGAGHGQQFLVYPFFEHGSLDWWLFHGEERRRLLPWPARRRIAGDVARALAYLHHECRRQILHLDIKPANILLDGGLRAHVSDFGISMSIAQDMTSVDTRGRGTVGYMAPEIWVSSLSAKSDVYSYGVTLLELVTGRRGFEAGRDSSEKPDLFARVVREKMARGEIMEVVDTAMASVDEGEVEVVAKVALCCVQHRRDLRPSMLTVVEMLEGRAAVDLPPESRLSVVDFIEPLSWPPTHGRR